MPESFFSSPETPDLDLSSTELIDSLALCKGVVEVVGGRLAAVVAVVVGRAAGLFRVLPVVRAFAVPGLVALGVVFGPVALLAATPATLLGGASFLEPNLGGDFLVSGPESVGGEASCGGEEGLAGVSTAVNGSFSLLAIMMRGYEKFNEVQIRRAMGCEDGSEGFPETVLSSVDLSPRKNRELGAGTTGLSHWAS